MGVPARKQYQNTTVRLPKRIYEQAKWVVEKRRTAAASLNEFVVEAVKEKLSDMYEADIDAAFAQMSNDPDYQREAISFAREFAVSDWDAFLAGEQNERSTIEQNNTKAGPATPKTGSR